MKLKQSLSQSVAVSVALFAMTTGASAEYQCAPQGLTIQYPTSDPFFISEMQAWSKTTKKRPTEGDSPKSCQDVMVPGYEGFPTKRCRYSEVDAGKISLEAEVIILSPSSQELASWSVNACRTNGASDFTMYKCLKSLRNQVISNDGAQFPVVGSVVESFCNSGSRGPCASLDKNSHWLQARHTWFRDGVAVWYAPAQGVLWQDKVYSKETFDAVFDVSKSDANVSSTKDVARIGGAVRSQWRAWRKHVGKSEMPDGGKGTVDGGGWRIVAATVHKAACKGAFNELFDAIVFAKPAWTKK